MLSPLHMISHLFPCNMRSLHELFWISQVGCGLQMYVGAWAISTWCRHTLSVWNLDHYNTISTSHLQQELQKAFILEDFSSSEQWEVDFRTPDRAIILIGKYFHYHGQFNHTSAWTDLKSSKKLSSCNHTEMQVAVKK